MDSKSKSLVLELLAARRGDVEAAARYLRDVLRIGGLKACRALVMEAQA